VLVGTPAQVGEQFGILLTLTTDNVIEGFFRAPQGKALPKCRLVDLDDADPGGLQIADLVAQRQARV